MPAATFAGNPGRRLLPCVQLVVRRTRRTISRTVYPARSNREVDLLSVSVTNSIFAAWSERVPAGGSGRFSDPKLRSCFSARIHQSVTHLLVFQLSAGRASNLHESALLVHCRPRSDFLLPGTTNVGVGRALPVVGWGDLAVSLLGIVQSHRDPLVGGIDPHCVFKCSLNDGYGIGEADQGDRQGLDRARSGRSEGLAFPLPVRTSCDNPQIGYSRVDSGPCSSTAR